MVEGLNENGRDALAGEFQGGEVHLLGTALNDSDGSTELSNNSEASTTTTNADWSITHDNGAGTTTLENSSDLNFGSTPDFTIDQIVVKSTVNSDELLLDNNPSGDTDLTGDGDTSIPGGQLSYTFGGE